MEGEDNFQEITKNSSTGRNYYYQNRMKIKFQTASFPLSQISRPTSQIIFACQIIQP